MLGGFADAEMLEAGGKKEIMGSRDKSLTTQNERIDDEYQWPLPPTSFKL
jgi:hypothetical protein